MGRKKRQSLPSMSADGPDPSPPKTRVEPSGSRMVRQPTENLSRALRTKREASVMRSAGGSVSDELRRWLGLAIKSRPLPPQMQGLPMDSDDDGEGHCRVAKEAAEHGAVV